MVGCSVKYIKKNMCLSHVKMIHGNLLEFLQFSLEKISVILFLMS
jgi:hypothetical protein